MASAAVSMLTPSKLGVPLRRPATFSGDSEDFLDMLVSACQAKTTRAADPRLFGRDLQPYDFSGAFAVDQKPASGKCAVSGGARAATNKPKRVAKPKEASAPSTRQQAPADANAKDQQAAAQRRGTPKKQQADSGAKRSRTSWAVCVSPASASAASPLAKGRGPARSGPVNGCLHNTPTAGARPSTVGASLVNSAARDHRGVDSSTTFAGPGFCCSPQPEHLPLPPPALLLRRI